MASPQPRADLASIVARGAPAFALLHRPQSGQPAAVEILVGRARQVPRIADLALPALSSDVDRPEVLAVVPYRQLVERGLACRDDATPLVAIDIQAWAQASLDEAVAELPEAEVRLAGGGFVPDDEEYQAIVRRVITDEIGAGAGSNFVIRRSFQASIANHSRQAALTVFRRLLALEQGTYWTFLVHWGGRTLVGATPERHISITDNVAVMNPISGTYRYPSQGPTTAGLLRFLGDGKEVDELFMVVDEELKMMAQVCRRGGRVIGPRLRPMARLAHTEYLIEGHTDGDVRDILRATMFAPTVTGSPLASACRVVANHESSGRGYYGGVLALVGQRHGQRQLDSAIVIRTADISPRGDLDIGVGATLVRHSDPGCETAETRAKVAALLAAFGPTPAAGAGAGAKHCAAAASAAAAFGTDRRVRQALASRNARLSQFWLGSGLGVPGGAQRGAGSGVRASERPLAGTSVLVIDAEDSFTAMLAHQIRALGARVRVQDVNEIWPDEIWRDEPWPPRDYHAVVLGPGPGDPRDRADPRLARLRRLTSDLVHSGVPMLAVCLSHQVLAQLLGLSLVRRSSPAQGVQREIVLCGQTERVGCYNTFAAYTDLDEFGCPFTGERVQVDRDPATGEVHGLSKPAVRSVQFHMESVLTEHGPALLSRLLTGALAGAGTAGPAPPGRQRSGRRRG